MTPYKQQKFLLCIFLLFVFGFLLLVFWFSSWVDFLPGLTLFLGWFLSLVDFIRVDFVPRPVFRWYIDTSNIAICTYLCIDMMVYVYNMQYARIILCVTFCICGKFPTCNACIYWMIACTMYCIMASDLVWPCHGAGLLGLAFYDNWPCADW